MFSKNFMQLSLKQVICLQDIEKTVERKMLSLSFSFFLSSCSLGFLSFLNYIVSHEDGGKIGGFIYDFINA